MARKIFQKYIYKKKGEKTDKAPSSTNFKYKLPRIQKWKISSPWISQK